MLLVDDVTNALRDLRHDAEEIFHLLTRERLERALEDFHRLDGDLARELAALRRQLDVDDAAILFRALAGDERFALHAVDDPRHRAVLRADALGELRQRQIA